MSASRYEHGLPDDPSLPGFAAALDPGAFVSHFAEAVEPAGLELCGGKLDRFRYRRGERLVVGYRIEAIEKVTGRARSLIVTGRIHADRPLSMRREKVARDCKVSDVTSLPALGMRIEIFPRDRRFPDLHTYVEEPCSPCVTRLVHAATGWRPTHADEITVDPVRYRPGIAATLHYRARNEGSGPTPRQCFVKLSSPENVVARPNPAAIFNRAFENERNPIRLSVPAYCEPKAGVAVFSAAPGRSLLQVALSTTDFKPLAQVGGEALARFHLARVPELSVAGPDRVQLEYERASDLLAWACPEARPALGRIEAAASAFWGAGVRGPTHGDMKPDHLFVSHDNQDVHLIDNDAVAIANPLADIGSMLARLDAMHWLEGVDEKRMRGIAEAFSDTYFAIVPEGWSRHLGQARALATLLVCQHAVQRLVPGWRTRVLAELEKASALL